MKNLNILNFLTAVIAVINAVIGFVSGNITAGLGWSVAACGYFALFFRGMEDSK